MEKVCPQKGMKKLSFIEMTCPYTCHIAQTHIRDMAGWATNL